jgi:hypothetical protein
VTAGDLRLVHASKAYPDASWPDDHFVVMHGERPIGGISREDMSGTGERWWWEITTGEAHRRPAAEIKGPARSRQDGMQAFRAAWDRLNAAGNFPTAPDSKTAP